MSIDRLLLICGTLALAGSSLTALRLPGLPIGVPEVLGLIFVLGSGLRTSRRLFPTIGYVLGFGALILLGMLIGGVNNALIGAPTVNLNQDLAAIVYAALLGALYANALIDRPRTVLWLGRALAIVLCLHAVPLVSDLVGVDIGRSGWSGDTEQTPSSLQAQDRLGKIEGAEALSDKADRYQGLTTNPNQFGMAAGFCAILFPWLAVGMRRTFAPAWWFFGLMSLVLLALTKSSTAILGVGVGWMLILVRHFAATEDDRGVARYPLVWLVATWALLLPALLVMWRFLDKAIAGPSGSGDASSRYPLWRHGWEGIARSHFLGVGPGPQSGLSGPFQGEEAHNVWIDLMLQGGLISMVALALLLWFVFRRSVQGHTKVGVAMMAFFVVMGTAHFLLRHPLYWSLICLPIAINYSYSRPARLWREEQRSQDRRRHGGVVVEPAYDRGA